MASLNYNCSVRQGFNFEKDRQVLVGHLVSITIGGQALTADMTLTDPLDYGSTVSVVGVISGISWQGGYADTVNISCNVSNENQKAVAILTHTNLSKNDVVFAFNIYDYDQQAKVYYKAFNSGDAALNGLIYKNGGELSLQISADSDNEVVSPLNFPMYIGIMPQESAQIINVAVSNTDKFVKTWGVAVSGS
ncbi:MAG: hypothetical protein QX196_10000 [Methylococcaceae bacterium]